MHIEPWNGASLLASPAIPGWLGGQSPPPAIVEVEHGLAVRVVARAVGEGRRAGGRLVDRNSQRVHVRRRAAGALQQHLRRHVLQRAHLKYTPGMQARPKGWGCEIEFDGHIRLGRKCKWRTLVWVG